jgi:hypothetical protein
VERGDADIQKYEVDVLAVCVPVDCQAAWAAL